MKDVAYALIVKKFLGNHKTENFIELVKSMINNFRDIGCNMGIKVHYLYIHLDHLPENLGDTSNKLGGRFYQNLMVMKNRYQSSGAQAMILGGA